MIKIGIIGCGGIANNKHMPALAKVEAVEMVAFCDIIEERQAKQERNFGTDAANVYTDYEELLKMKRLMSSMSVHQIFLMLKSQSQRWNPVNM